MAVYELAVRWGCGHYRALPPLPTARLNHFHSKAKQPKGKAARPAWWNGGVISGMTISSAESEEPS
jgi:hypothetical protein